MRIDKLISLENLGTVNKNLVIIGGLKLWFSYKSIVAFETPNGKFYCIANQWGNTTGKLLNELEPDKSKRLTEDDFLKELEKMSNNIDQVFEGC